MEDIKLSNGIDMPRLFQGLPLIGRLASIDNNLFLTIIRNSYKYGIKGLDTSHDYGKSEEFIKYSLSKLKNEGIDRSTFFICTKIGNSQQYEGNIEAYVDASLKTMGLDYIDLMLLHWPVPGKDIENWHKLESVYKKGKLRAIGIANAQVRHLKNLVENSEMPPHVLQTEIHPFNTCEEVRQYCAENNIALQACSSLCLMIDMVKYNPTLLSLSAKYNKSVAQIMLRWSLQSNIAPIFRAFKEYHLREMSDLFSFEISKEDMLLINSLNVNYRYHPESFNCAGF